MTTVATLRSARKVAERDLRDLVDRSIDLTDEIAEAVRQARGIGVSWATIGDVLGLSGEGARTRWGRASARPLPSSNVESPASFS